MAIACVLITISCFKWFQGLLSGNINCKIVATTDYGYTLQLFDTINVVILGLVETFFASGYDAGAALMGVLFGTLGTRMTLLVYSIMSGLILAILLLYICFSNHVSDYEKLTQEDSDEESCE